MKKFKLIPAIAFILILVVYISVYESTSDSSEFEKLTIQERVTFFQLEENDRIKIIGLPQDSIESKSDFSDTARVILANTPPTTYQVYQDVSEQGADVSKTIFIFKRLILLVFLFLTSYLSYTKVHKFNVAFQKILFENVLGSIVFALFSVTAFLITQYLRGNVGDISYMLQMLLGDGIETLKYGLLYSIFISIFLYFDPRNIHWYNKRLAKKQAAEEKAKEN